MNSQLIVLIICLGAVAVFAQEEAESLAIQSAGKGPERSCIDPHLRREVQEQRKQLENIERTAHSISNAQKGIEGKLKIISRDVSEIEHVEDAVKKLNTLTEVNSKITAQGLKNLTRSIESAGNRTDRAIQGLNRSQQEIKRVLVQVDANQNKYEKNLDAVAKSVIDRLNGFDNLIKKEVLGKLLILIQNAKNVEHSQKQIENKIGYLDELTALSGITANKVQLLEQGIRSLNVSQQQQLAAIGATVRQVGSTTWQIDNKLGVLLSTQKNIERGLEECKKCQRHPGKDHHYDAPEHHEDSYAEPSYIPDYDHKEADKSSSSNSEYGSDYSSSIGGGASYLYSLWYGDNNNNKN